MALTDVVEWRDDEGKSELEISNLEFDYDR
jgi:hypothetical protein